MRATRAQDNKSFKQHQLLNLWSKFKIIAQNFPHDAFYNICTNSSAPLNKGVARALDKNFNNIWTTGPNTINFMELFLMMPSTKVAQIVLLRLSKGLLELLIRNIFKQHLLNHWSKFKIISQTCSMGAQWLSGRVLDSRPKGRGFEPHRRHCVVVLEQDTFILA